MAARAVGVRLRAVARLGACVGPLRDRGTGDCLVLLFCVFKSRRWSLDWVLVGANAPRHWPQGARRGRGAQDQGSLSQQTALYKEGFIWRKKPESF